MCLTVAALGVLRYPLEPWFLTLGLVTYGAILWIVPSTWLFVVPAALPTLDLAPWTGWFYWDELDLLILVTLGVSLCRGLSLRRPLLPRWGWILLGGMAASLLVSLLIGFFPFEKPNLNSFANYYSRYNAFRVAKGIGWAFLLSPLLLWREGNVPQLFRLFLAGVVAGLAVVLGVVLWERQIFSGILNFSSDFRINATFSSMHTGGGHVEAFLSLALPLVAAWCCGVNRSRAWVAGVVLWGLGLYAMVVTYSRAGYLAVAVSGFVWVAWYFGRRGSRVQSRCWVALAAIGLAFGLVLAGAESPYMRSRFRGIHPDMATRGEHWEGAAAMVRSDPLNQVFGMGLGSFPRLYAETSAWKQKNGAPWHPSAFEFEREGDNNFLRLWGGDSVYFGQRVSIKNNRTYELSLDARSDGFGAQLTLPLCEKDLLYSFRCVWKTLNVNRSGRQWRSYQIVFSSANLGNAGWFFQRPVELALFNPNPEPAVDVDNVALVDENGRSLVSNGDFSRGSQRWFFETDNHLPWHVKNVFVSMYLEQGWLGLTSFVGFMSWMLWALARKAWRGDTAAAAFLSAFAGFLTVGIFDSPFDAPRLGTLFYLACFITILDFRGFPEGAKSGYRSVHPSRDK